ncbi:uncharacterized protein LOC119369242 [Jatropha curcas]|uniref:uncharacterized protein LOC119369242 n=1 Tax=Jatropha curcas TaxID=180498 RepID=UPI0018956287|nr:uncharacterized protein LOC119369242 [Jatropha curcas]
MAKAFDRISWKYLEAVLLKIGFFDKLVNLILSHLKSTIFSVLINGISYGSFRPTRGIKQGIRFRHSYDLLIFINGDVKSAKQFKEFLQLYQRASGQLVNLSKSSFVCSSQVTSAYRDKIHSILSITGKDLPFMYLGAPIYKGINRAQYCSYLLQKIDAKLKGWTKKFLSIGGRLLLIKHVLSSIPRHTLRAMSLPKSIIAILEKKFADFFWSSDTTIRRYHWLKYSRFCFLVEEGGLGLRSLTSLQEAYSLKLWWRYCEGKSLLAKLLQKKYHRKGLMQFKTTDSYTWKRICQVHSTASTLISIEEDGPCWLANNRESFCLKLAYDLVRQRKSATLSYRSIWDPNIPAKISIFTWKILQGVVPLPSHLQKMGIQLASCCPFCCAAEGSTNHVFFNCSKIQLVWKFFRDSFFNKALTAPSL